MMHKFLPFDDNLNDEDNFQKNTQMRNVAKFNVFTNQEATANRIQAWYRGCSLRKQLKKQDDKYFHDSLFVIAGAIIRKLYSTLRIKIYKRKIIKSAKAYAEKIILA